MSEYGEEKNLRFGRQHIAAALSAFFASIIFHVLLLMFVMTLPFSVAMLMAKQAKKQVERPITVVSVDREPMGAGTAPSGDDRQPGKTEQKDIDMVKAVKDLSVPVDRAVTEPKPVDVADFKGESAALTEAPEAPKPSAWEARQEILAIDRTKAVGPLYYERRIIPVIERVSNAPDITYTVDREDVGKRVSGKASVPKLAKGWGGAPGGDGLTGPFKPRDTQKPQEPEDKKDLFKEKKDKITDRQAIEKFLKIKVSKYEPLLSDRDHMYVKVEIARMGEEELPVIPKDVLIVQDSSNSMAEQRLHFCRDGLNRCLNLIGPKDRFNIVRFRETSVRCFSNWVDNTRENIQTALKFVEETKPGSNTDIYGSLSGFISEQRDPLRPVVMMLVSDGVPTVGMVDSSDIIGKFSAKNNGQMTVFTFGTVKMANDYLLDLVSYCNRGANHVVRSGRWDIPEGMESFFGSFRRPVLADISINLPGTDKGEFYPKLVSNLYLDRSMVLYGRYPRSQKKLLLQAVGQARAQGCDMVFDVDLEKAQGGDKKIRDEWAKQKIYHLIGKHARTSEKTIMDDIVDTAKAYDIEVPYKKQL